MQRHLHTSIALTASALRYRLVRIDLHLPEAVRRDVRIVSVSRVRRHFGPDPALPDPVTFIKTATIVMDTNALLELYRYSVGTRDTALEALKAVQDRLWMPHQVSVEFFRNHKKNRSALSQAYDQAHILLEKARKDVREVFGTGKKFEESRKAVGQKVDGSLNDLKATLGRLRDTDQAIIDEHDDPVFDHLTELYGDRWGPKPDALTVRKRVEDFHQWRVPNEIPPGFRDIETKDNPTHAAGDYLIWAEALERAGELGLDVLLVTNDSKNDWWEQVPGERPRPRRELVEEFAEQTGHAYQQLSLLEFITTVKAAYGVNVEKGAVDEIAEIEKQEAELAQRKLRVHNVSLAADVLDSERDQLWRAFDAERGITNLADLRRRRERIRRILEAESRITKLSEHQDRIQSILEAESKLPEIADVQKRGERIRRILEAESSLSNEGIHRQNDGQAVVGENFDDRRRDGDAPQ
jgi:hypothetical protein